MKKLFLALALVMAMAVTANAQIANTVGIGYIRDLNQNQNTNIVAPIVAPVIAPVIAPTNVDVNNIDINSKSKATAVQGQMNNWVQTFEDSRELPAALPIIPQVIPLIQGGRVGDVTAQVVKFAIPAKPYNGELVVKILKIVSGSIFDRVRLEDIEADLLSAFNGLPKDKATDGGKKIRYLVQYKDSAMGTGLNIGTAGSISGLNGGSSSYGATGSVGAGAGYTRSTADPMYIIKFFLVQ